MRHFYFLNYDPSIETFVRQSILSFKINARFEKFDPTLENIACMKSFTYPICCQNSIDR